MTNEVDKRGVLDEEVFTYGISKDQKVFISYYGKQIMTLSGGKAEKFIADIDGAEGKEAQLILAKVTGNFKRGNEKLAKRRGSNRRLFIEGLSGWACIIGASGTAAAAFFTPSLGVCDPLGRLGVAITVVGPAGGLKDKTFTAVAKE